MIFSPWKKKKRSWTGRIWKVLKTPFCGISQLQTPSKTLLYSLYQFNAAVFESHYNPFFALSSIHYAQTLQTIFLRLRPSPLRRRTSLWTSCSSTFFCLLSFGIHLSRFLSLDHFFSFLFNSNYFVNLTFLWSVLSDYDYYYTKHEHLILPHR